MSKFVKIVVTVPLTHADEVRQVMAKAGAGHLGNYDSCSFSQPGVGRFRPMRGAKPFVGREDKIEEVKEKRIEVTCPAEKTSTVIAAIKKAHPYEEPVIDMYPLLEDKY